MKRHSAILNFWHNQKKNRLQEKQCTYSGTKNWRSACRTRKIKHWICKENFLLVFSMKELWELWISKCQQLSSRKNCSKFTSTFFPRYKVSLASKRRQITFATRASWREVNLKVTKEERETVFFSRKSMIVLSLTKIQEKLCSDKFV